jgi:hypothetical protein
MPVDHIRYDLLTREALRSVVRRVLADVARSGLPGEHHFYITFDTRAPGVRIPARLREEYPEAMTIVLQHQFYDLGVGEANFEVGLSFGGAVERLIVPFDAITGFVDPSVQFGLQFETLGEADEAPAPEKGAAAVPQAEPKAPRTRRVAPAEAKSSDKPASVPKTPQPEKRAPAKADAAAAPEESGDRPSGGAEVVRLDRFRKK